MSKTLYLSPPSFDGFDGGAGARYQARREVTSYWYPTWLAQPAALTPGSRLLDCPPHDIDVAKCLAIAKDFDHVIINTSTPSLKNDCKVAEAIKAQKPDTKIGFIGAHTMVLPTETLKASPAIDWVGRKEFDYTCAEVAEDRPLSTVAGLSYKNADGKIIHNPEREMIPNMDALPWVADVYKRDLQIEKYFIGYLLHPYVSLYTGRGCPAQCTFCLWPQTIGGHKYRVRSPQNVADEMFYMKKIFPQVREFFFDDDTFTANLPRASWAGSKSTTSSRDPPGRETLVGKSNSTIPRILQVFVGERGWKSGTSDAPVLRSSTKAAGPSGIPADVRSGPRSSERITGPMRGPATTSWWPP